jgi:hypothetical protein
VPERFRREAASRSSLRRLYVAVNVGREVVSVARGVGRDLREEFADVLGRYPVTEQRRNLVVRNPGPGDDRFATADTGIDLDMLPRLKQGRDLPSLAFPLANTASDLGLLSLNPRRVKAVWYVGVAEYCRGHA